MIFILISCPMLNIGGGLAYLASVLKVVREQEPQALILDGGDFYKKGSLPAYKTQDEVTADLLSQMSFYDARAVGNNEIKVGIEKLILWSKKKESAPLLSANLVDKDGHPLFKTHFIFKKNGLTVAIIGLTVPFPIENQWQPKKDSHAPYKILPPEEVLTGLITKLRTQVDVLILNSHHVHRENVALAKKYPQLDLIVSGHSHVLTSDQKVNGKNLVVEAGEFGQQLGAVTLVFDKTEKRVAQIESTFWPINSEMQLPDKNLQDRIDAAYKKWAPEAFEKLAVTQGKLGMISSSSPLEGALHDWLADILLNNTQADGAFVNREMLRETIAKGPITKEGLFLALPYDNELVTFKIKKDQWEAMLKDAIETRWAAQKLMPFGFSKISVRLKNDKASVTVPKKSVLKIATASYVTEHCSEFFAQRFCPFQDVKTVASDIHTVVEKALTTQKIISPPVLDRVSADIE